MRRSLAGLVLFALALALPGTAFAQRVTGQIIGTVTDPSGAVVPKVSVELVNLDNGSKRDEIGRASCRERVSPRV